MQHLQQPLYTASYTYGCENQLYIAKTSSYSQLLMIGTASYILYSQLYLVRVAIASQLASHSCIQPVIACSQLYLVRVAIAIASQLASHSCIQPVIACSQLYIVCIQLFLYLGDSVCYYYYPIQLAILHRYSCIASQIASQY